MKRIFLTLLIALITTAAPVQAMHPDPDSTPHATAGVQADPAAQSFACGYSAATAGLLEKTSAHQWQAWINKLSGAEPVIINGQPVTIKTRHSEALFNGQSPAYTFLLQQLKSWYPDQSSVEEDPYKVIFNSQNRVWKNVIVTIPGKTRPEEIVILSAHFDSTNGLAAFPPVEPSPGADDNASGAAALLEAARLLKDHPLDRTMKLIWFTGEEQGLLGSSAYVREHDPAEMIGVINLDMYAYDSNNDRCFELHVGHLEASHQVGYCITQSIEAYGLNLSYDYLTGDQATHASDHASFWAREIGAVQVLENFFVNDLPGGCSEGDRNPYYHTAGDTVEGINRSTGFDITRAALAAAFSMAAAPPPPAVYFPQLLMN